MDTQTFEHTLEERTVQADQMVMRYLPKEEGPQKELIQAMNYSLLAGGKRLRPILMRETYGMCRKESCRTVVTEEELSAFMAAIEMIHTYSLVHDDLPAMDNDRYRRGRETTWYVYGDAMGILAGDGLLNYAFETALGTLTGCGEKEKMERLSGALSILARKAGVYGMIGGQAVDVRDSGLTPGSGRETDMTPQQREERLLFIHGHKTAALIEASMMTGAVLAGAGPEQVKKIEKCAYNVGIAFQIQDDILDVTGDSRELGKATGGDAANHKLTYVGLKGLKKAGEDVEALSREAAEILDGFEGEHEFLKQLILWLIRRRR